MRLKLSKNEINAQDDQLVKKLQREIQHLRDLLQMRRKGGDKQSLEQQVFRLRAENDRLREIALSIEEVERLKQENKQMRIEMQKIMLVDGYGAEVEVASAIERTNSHSQPRFKGAIEEEHIGMQVSKSNENLHQKNHRKRIIAEINQTPTSNSGNAQETMKFVKRRIQDTGATEEEEQDI